jgi:DNA polymerase III epsilon subunit-like protein
MILSAEYLKHRRPQMPSFKLHRVALELGISIDKSQQHEALYDARLTREIYQIVTGLREELM